MAMAAAAARRRVHGAGEASGGRWAAYELVLRRLTADDRLCAALTCRAFRDVLFALTTVVVKRDGSKDRPAGRLQGGRPQPRFRTAPRALACSASRTRWACSLQRGAQPLWLARWDRDTCAVLRQLVKRLLALRATTEDAAALMALLVLAGRYFDQASSDEIGSF